MREQKDRYEIFLKVCETGSFSKAAEALNYTQSGISQMMAGLEEELGVQLFARINRGVTLTDNGTRLLPYIRELANQKIRLRQAAFNINHKVEGKLRVGSFSSITTLWMPEVVHYFKENYPHSAFGDDGTYVNVAVYEKEKEIFIDISHYAVAGKRPGDKFKIAYHGVVYAKVVRIEDE